MRYFFARLEEQARVRGYRTYVTDALKVFVGAETRYADMFEPQKVETRTADEIKESIKNKLRGLDGSVQSVSETDT